MDAISVSVQKSHSRVFIVVGMLKHQALTMTPTPTLSVLPSTCITLIVILLCLCRESIAMLKEEGFDNVVARHHRLAEGVRQAVEGWGLKVGSCV
jgi:aspartate aminotransferase-like enzyme